MVNNNSVKRLDSTKEYIDALGNKYSKLNIIRVDLAYKKPHSNEVTLDEANVDLNRMFNNTRSKPTIFDGKVGYVCKKEFTDDKGIHIHALFIYDGQKVQKDVFKAEQIGKYWENDITKGAGSYHNCNRSTYDNNGLGMLGYNDFEKRKILDEQVIPYLCKDGQTIDAVKTNKKDRAFTRGVIPKRKGNIGRPRVCKTQDNA